MPIDLASIGRSRTKANVVTPRWALAYAGSLGLTSENYLDDTQGDGLVVPPTFCVCLEWTLSDIEQGASLMGLTPEERRMGVHAVQDSRFIKPYRLGMRVVTTSTLVHMRQTRAGTFTLTRFDHHDDKTGDTLVTSYSGGMLRRIPLGTSSVGELPADYTEVRGPGGNESLIASVSMDRALPHIYSECARIWNPIHTEREVALAAGLEDIIVHGTITWTLAAREVCKALKLRDMGALRRLVASFRAPIIAGRPMAVSAGQPHDAQIAFTARNERGVEILSNGLVEIAR